jgi:hypothetical protein
MERTASMARKVSAAIKGAAMEEPKRLSPTPDTLRQLYLLSGNRCAMPSCKNLVIDGNGVVVGHICHIRAAMPDGARFDVTMTNEERRQASNLLLLCGGHHTQIDSEKYEDLYPVERVKKIKRDHEAKFKGVGDSLFKAFSDEYVDVTDALDRTKARNFVRFEQVLQEDGLEPDEFIERQEQVAAYVARMQVVPDAERIFMLAVIKRAIKLDARFGVNVPITDLRNAIGISQNKLRTMGDALERYGVGRIDLSGTAAGDDYCFWIREPSEYITWFDLARFCDKVGILLDEFVLRLKFGMLDS